MAGGGPPSTTFFRGAAKSWMPTFVGMTGERIQVPSIDSVIFARRLKLAPMEPSPAMTQKDCGRYAMSMAPDAASASISAGV